MNRLLSWGRYPFQPQIPHPVNWPDEISQHISKLETEGCQNTLAFGCGRSYGDSCLAESNHVLSMTGMDRLLATNWETGLITAQSGLNLAELISIALPHGWFLPVTPGTKYVTLGGAVANDVHGKNHHVMGTFGCHVQELTIYRSDNGVVRCSPAVQPELFAATVGGLGLTGVILTVQIQLRRILSSQIHQRTIRFDNLDEFFELSELHDVDNEYSVAWIDCLASGKQAGRGHFIVGNHAESGQLRLAPSHSLRIAIDPPFSLINRLSLALFNSAYYHRQRDKEVRRLVEYEPFFYPLDRLLQWNRLYGRAGFQQYQCVIPQQHGRDVIRAVIHEIAKSGTGSFLAVLKQCGNIVSPGLLSFPLPGVSLALDFPQREKLNEQLFSILDDLVHEAGGRLYPAKDAHMTATHFRQAYNHWEKIEALRDPKLLSKFWQRVTQ
jgi:FAD/FMN-containing dehydrogenase